jgi:hypothetical protein
MLRKLCDLEWWIEEATAGTEWDVLGGAGLQYNGEFDAADSEECSTNTDNIKGTAEATGTEEEVCTERHCMGVCG